MPDNPVIDFLLRRRSTSVRLLADPAPSEADLELILRCATRVPDHGKLTPWRISLFEGDARARIGAGLEAIVRKRQTDASEAVLKVERERLLRAPLVAAVSTHIRATDRIPESEQLMSAGAVCMNLVTSALALGYGATWLTEWIATDQAAKALLGVEPNDQIVGLVYIGTRMEAPQERPRPELADVVRRINS